MRKYHQQQLLDLVKTLQEAHGEIKVMLFSGEKHALLALLSDCQESAVRIGGFIEQMEGEGTKTVTFLESYCELLYQISIFSDGSGNGAGLLKQLRKQLHIIENSIKNELKPDRLEMLFIPYKASMWDSMESVWMAAQKDPKCTAIVMPIPYYDKNADGTLAQMHYEGEQYPDYVPVADWRKYCLEERHPDVIVTCNPYDGGNLVTSIHPDFYNQRLKDFSDLLLYIPYFVSIEDVPTHFCICAGTLFADRIIVQSDKVKETYLQEFHKFEREKNRIGRFGKAETKFVALGSPKFDKVIGTKREDCSIPGEWIKHIKKPDGSSKQVILYNTSIFGALKENEKALCKLRYVFNCFRDRDDTVLLWRPHPLNDITYETMRPQLYQEYLDIVTEYKQQGFGIYDDTADMNRAIAISDAYYGDMSSLVILYQMTGKPVMIQNVDISKESQSVSLSFGNLFDDGDDFWFTAREFNGLFKMDKQTWKTEYMGCFPDEPVDGQRLYGQIASCEGKLYFAPDFASTIAEYDTTSRKFRKIEIPYLEGTFFQDFSGTKFNEVFHYQDWLFFIGSYYPGILRLNIKNGRADIYTEWLAPLSELAAEFGGPYFKSACVVDTCIAIAALNANAVVLFDMVSCKSIVHEVGNKANRYTGICFDGNDYWLSPRYAGSVVRWSPETSYKEYDRFPANFSYGKVSFWGICYISGHVWLFPNQANMTLKINIGDESITVSEEFPTESHSDDPASEYIYLRVLDGKIFAFTGKSKKLIKYDCEFQQRQEDHIVVSADDLSVLVRTDIFNKDIAACTTPWDCMFFENHWQSLADYLAGTVRFNEQEEAGKLSARQIEICKNTISNADGTSGEKVYAHCKHALLHDSGGKQ